MPDSVWGTDGSSESEDSVPTEPEGSAPNGKQQDGPAPTFGAGPVPSDPTVARPPRDRGAPEPVPDWLKSDPYADTTPPGRDPVAVTAVALGFAGIVFFGMLLAVVTAVLGAYAGQRARESGRTYELPFLAIGLAFVDGVVWLVLHTLLDVPLWIG